MEKNAAQVPCSLPDTELRESVPQQLVTSALQSEGIKEVFKLPNTKFKLLQQLLTRAISAFKQMNRHKGIDLGDKLWALVKCYNNRKEGAPLRSEALEDFT